MTGQTGSMLLQRQRDLYGSPKMNEQSDIFSTVFNDHSFKEQVTSLAGDKDDVWSKYLTQTTAIEEADLLRIPSEYREWVYFKAFQVNHQLVKEKYANLLNKAGFAPYSKDIPQNPLKLFAYYTNDILSHSLNRVDNINEVGSKEELVGFVKSISRVLDLQIDEKDQFYVLLKFGKLWSNTDKKELYYIISRTLEELTPKAFVHVTKQGIQLKKVIQHQVEAFFPDAPIGLLQTLLDLVVFEGLTVISRFIVWLFDTNTRILELEGDELASYLFSDEFYLEDIQQSLTYEPSIVVYENEYHLIYLNLLNNNRNYELLNAKEAGLDLDNTIKLLEAEIAELSLTHEEIVQQAQEVDGQIEQEEAKNRKLVGEHTQLKERFDKVTLKANLDNTIKANKEISARNAELEEQIAKLEKKIARHK